jgi:NADPH:quinone reductase-like Zn-dependent oxidoreductase
VNPSDLGLLLGPADLRGARQSGSALRPVVTAPIPEALRPAVAARVGQSLPVGNEGAGVVVAAGRAPEAQALLGKTVALVGGAMYARFRTVGARWCLRLPDGTAPAAGAACFVNPLTALGMVETMRREGHTALVHTAAASNLGQMLVKLCKKDGVPLVNVVRKPEQAELLRGLGATHVCDSRAPGFTDDLTRALAETGATLCFDAVGGGDLASRILACMEAAAVAKLPDYSRYGSTTFKQVYLYGSLDRGPTQLVRSYGMAWAVGGWLLTPFLQKIGPAAAEALRQRVVDELTTTFASHYERTLSLAEALDLENLRAYARLGTGTKVLIDPSRDD